MNNKIILNMILDIKNRVTNENYDTLQWDKLILEFKKADYNVIGQKD